MKPKKSSLSPSPSPSHSVSRDLIAARAEAIWRERGSPVGRDQEHWLEAERQLGRGPAGDDLERRSPDFSPDRDDALKNDVDKALDGLDNPAPQRSATSL